MSSKLTPVMNWNDVAEIEEQSQPETLTALTFLLLRVFSGIFHGHSVRIHIEERKKNPSAQGHAHTEIYSSSKLHADYI